MEKWEYCKVFTQMAYVLSNKQLTQESNRTLIFKDFSSGNIDIYSNLFSKDITISGDYANYTEVDSAGATLAQLGNEGWELVNVTRDSYWVENLLLITIEHWFKRPID